MTMPTPAMLSAADQMLVHAVVWMVANMSDDHANFGLVREVLRDVAPLATVSVPMIRDFARVGIGFATATGADLARARSDARFLVERWSMARIAAAQERMADKSKGAAA